MLCIVILPGAVKTANIISRKPAGFHITFRKENITPGKARNTTFYISTASIGFCHRNPLLLALFWTAQKEGSTNFALPSSLWSSIESLAFGLLFVFCGAQRVLKQHCDSHGADTARHRSDKPRLFAAGFEIHIAAEPAVCAVYADVDYYRAGLYHIRADKLRLAAGDNKYIRPFGMRAQIRRFGMAERYGAVFVKL